VATYGTDPWVALGDPSRRGIFARLAAGPQSVTELASTLTISRPAVSQHLKVLKAADLVTVRAEGTRRIYAVHPPGLAALRSELEDYWRTTLTNLKELAEQTHRSTGREQTP
jgi:DNA-binding transcriptional ArsR family regulator